MTLSASESDDPYRDLDGAQSPEIANKAGSDLAACSEQSEY